MLHARYRSTGKNRTRHLESAEMEPLPGMLHILYTIYDQSQNFFLFRYFLGFLKARRKAGQAWCYDCSKRDPADEPV